MFPSKEPPVPSTGSSSSTTVIWVDATDSAYGLSTSGTAAANATALGLADAAAVAAGKKLWIPYASSNYSTTAVTFTAPVVLDGILAWSAGAVTFNGGGTNEWTISQHFAITGTGTATFSKQKTIVGYAEWWGAVSNSAGTDCMAALNACLIAVTKTQLMPAAYYTSGTVNNALGVHVLVGACTNMYGTTESIICCTSSSATILSVSGGSGTGGASGAEDLLITRSVAPLISSACIGVNVTAYYAGIKRVFSLESMIGFKFNSTIGCLVDECRASRSKVGTGGGADTFKGFWMDGTPAGYGGNASLYTRKCITVTVSPFSGTSWGYYCDKKHSDLFFDHIESWHVTHGMEVLGDNAASGVTASMDFKVIHGVFDSCYGSALKITNTDINATLSFTDMELNCTTAGQKLLDISGSDGAVSLKGTQYISNGNIGAAISIVNSINVDSHDGIIMEARLPMNLSGSSDCSFSDRVVNNSYTGTGILLTTTNRCKFDNKMVGGLVGIGYKVLDATSSYNEFNCSGLNPTGITGGAANKLVINGVQVTVAYVPDANGNMATGIMA